MTKFSILDFPEDKVYVLLKERFRKRMFKEAGSFKKIGKRLRVSDVMVSNWYKGVNSRKVQCTPLWVINKISKLLSSSQRKKFSKQIDKNVIKYQARGGAPVLNPKLPIMEDERLIRIFFHLAGDGYGGRYGGSRTFYFNTNKSVAKEFMKDFSVFGTVKFGFEDNKRRIYFPKVISHILKHVYKVDFLSDKLRIPKNFFVLKPEIIFQGIKVFADDEGTVDSYKIRIYSTNKEFLKGISHLLKNKCPELFKHIQLAGRSSINLYYLVINSRGMEIYKKFIGFKHDKKKRDLKFYLQLKRRRMKKRDGVAKMKILNVLVKKVMTTKEIAYKIKAYPSMVSNHINGYVSNKKHIEGLKEKGLVKLAKQKRGKRFWKITSKGKQYLNHL